MAQLLDLDNYARISAELDGGEPRDHVLEKEGLSSEHWFASQRWHLDKMGSEAARQRFIHAQAFQRLYVLYRKASAARKAEKEKRLLSEGQKNRLEAPAPQLVAAPAQAAAPLAAGVGAFHYEDQNPRLTLPQWAGLCAEIAVRPTASPEILQRWGFDTAGYEREGSLWQLRFHDEPPLFEAYLARFREYRDYLMGANR